MQAIITSPEPIKDVAYGSVPKIVSCITYAMTISDVRIKLIRVGLISLLAIKRVAYCVALMIATEKSPTHCHPSYFSTPIDDNRIHRFPPNASNTIATIRLARLS